MSGWRRVKESDAWLDPERVNVSPPLGASDPTTGQFVEWGEAPVLVIDGVSPLAAVLDTTGKYAVFSLTAELSAAALDAGRMEMTHRSELVHIFVPKRQP